MPSTVIYESFYRLHLDSTSPLFYVEKHLANSQKGSPS